MFHPILFLTITNTYYIERKRSNPIVVFLRSFSSSSFTKRPMEGLPVMLVRGAKLVRLIGVSSSLSESTRTGLRLRGAILLRVNWLLRLAPKAEAPKPLVLVGPEGFKREADIDGRVGEAKERVPRMLVRPRKTGSSSSEELIASTVF